MLYLHIGRDQEWNGTGYVALPGFTIESWFVAVAAAAVAAVVAVVFVVVAAGVAAVFVLFLLEMSDRVQ